MPRHTHTNTQETPPLNGCVFDEFRVNAQSLFVSSRENSTFITKKSYFSLRHQVTTFLFQLRELLYTGQIKHNVADDVLRPFVMYLEQLNALPVIDILHTVHSTMGNQVNLCACFGHILAAISFNCAAFHAKRVCISVKIARPSPAARPH